MADNQLVNDLESELLDRYGPILSAQQLASIFAYPTLAAFRQAVTRGTVPVPVFSIEKRRGKYALAKDVARWMAEKREAARAARRK